MSTIIYWFITIATIVEVILIDVLMYITDDEVKKKKLKKEFITTSLLYVIFHICIRIL